MFSDYTDICHFLNKLGLFHMDLGLDRVSYALKALKLTSPPFVTVQIVGTNGKGSTSTFLESLARAQGLRTGLFTSPHFVSPHERIQIDGQPLQQQRWPTLANAVHKAAPSLTYFEFLTVLAALAFAESGVDIAIIEAGLGGHYDATTALTRHALCISPISLDHESILGDTVLAIAKDKAHAIGKNMPVFMATQLPQVQNILEEFATKQEATLYQAKLDTIPPSSILGLHGAHQQENAALALTAWQWLAKQFSWPRTEDGIACGLASAFIAGRLQHIITTEENLPKHILLDGAHNTHGLEVLYSYIKQLDQKPSGIIFSCLADKDRQQMLPILQKIHALCDYCPLYLTDIQNNDRALSQEDKKNLAQILGENVHLCSDISKSLIKARHGSLKGPVLLCGSLYLLGEFFASYPHYLVKPRG